MPRGPCPPSGMLSGHGVLFQTSYFSTLHWKLRAATAWVCRLEGWRSGQGVLRHKARGAVEDKTTGSKGTAHRPVTSSDLPERYFRSLQWFYWDIVFIMKERQPLKPSEPLWERRETWHKCVWFYRVLCCWGHKLTGIIVLTVNCDFVIFVSLPLVPQLPLFSLLCVPEGWPLVISWCSQPCDPT